MFQWGGVMTKSSSFWLFLCLLLVACGGEAPAPADSAAAPTAEPEFAEGCSLVMGWDPWEPYLYGDVDGTVRGLDIELISAISEQAGCEISFAQASWSELLKRLRAGEVDVVAGASKTRNREAFARFSDPYRRETFALYVRDTEASKYPSTVIGDVLALGMKVGVVSDYVYGDEIAALQDDAQYANQFVEVPISELNYVSLLDYKIDGFLEDPFVAATILRKKGYAEDIEQHPLVVDTGAVHFMFSRATVSGAIVDSLNQALSELIADGRYQAILDKYSL